MEVENSNILGKKMLGERMIPDFHNFMTKFLHYFHFRFQFRLGFHFEFFFLSLTVRF